MGMKTQSCDGTVLYCTVLYCTVLYSLVSLLPKPASRVQGGPQGSPGRLRCQVGRQGRDGLCIVTRVVGELHRDRLRGPLRNGSIELLYGSLRLYSLVEPNEANSLGEAWNRALLGAACKNINKSDSPGRKYPNIELKLANQDSLRAKNVHKRKERYFVEFSFFILICLKTFLMSFCIYQSLT